MTVTNWLGYDSYLNFDNRKSSPNDLSSSWSDMNSGRFEPQPILPLGR